MARHRPRRSVIAMRLLVTGRKVDITPALRQLIERKLVRAQRLLNDTAVSAQVILRVEKYRRVADVTIHARGDHMLHGIGEDQDWASAVKGAIDKIAQQATKLKSKWNTRKHRAGGAGSCNPVRRNVRFRLPHLADRARSRSNSSQSDARCLPRALDVGDRLARPARG